MTRVALWREIAATLSAEIGRGHFGQGDKLPTEQREMLMLVAADMSYEEAAEITGCAIGTVKSRIARGRVALKRLLGEGAENEITEPGREFAGDR